MTRKTIPVVTLTWTPDGWTASTFTDDAAGTQFTTIKAATDNEAVEDLIAMCARHTIVAEFGERVVVRGQRRLL